MHRPKILYFPLRATAGQRSNGNKTNIAHKHKSVHWRMLLNLIE